MTAPATDNQEQKQENKPSDKELNFRALEQKYQRQLEQERQARLEAERQFQEAQNSKNTKEEEEDDSEPYVDHKRLTKKMAAFEKNIEKKIEQKAEEKARLLLAEQKRESWIKNNPDFYDVLQHADKFAEKDPELAETILEMPESFERQKLVYKNIKALGIHKPDPGPSTIQQKIDANRRSPYYQPSGVGTAPYNSQGDFSPTGQKNAYEKMQQLKKTLRLG
jgi:hypothetical protein